MQKINMEYVPSVQVYEVCLVNFNGGISAAAANSSRR